MLRRFISLMGMCFLSLAGQAQPPTDDEFATSVVAAGLDAPWDMEFAPDGRLFISERAGRIRIWENGRLQDKPWIEVWVARAAESKLMGLAIDPVFQDPFVDLGNLSEFHQQALNLGGTYL
jgi:glucose/arabinose dehydrogenase